MTEPGPSGSLVGNNSFAGSIDGAVQGGEEGRASDTFSSLLIANIIQAGLVVCPGTRLLILVMDYAAQGTQ